VKVNCASLPDSALDVELFGAARSIQGGAASQRAGYFEEAAGGTILLDRVAELPAAIQAKLSHVTETGRFQRVGAPSEIPTSARILASTNCSLEERVRAGHFREELFYRLNVVELNVPPLWERREDILPLAGQFLAELTSGRAKLSAAASESLQSYIWPGNVRELRNAMERAALLSRGELILPEHLPARVRTAGGGIGTEALEPQPLEEVEEQAILAALRKHGFNRTDTARALGISRRGLIYKLQHLRERGYKVDAE
jgi:two-component system response regulator AtoC